MKPLLALSVLIAAAAVPALAQESRIAVPHEHFVLPNGLTVILHPDPTTPTIATNIWFHVGSANERPDRTGFAHLFEHLMFEGSANVAPGMLDEWFEEVGGSPNGTTSRDRTNYFQTFSSNALDMALFIESDRMGYMLEAMPPDVVDGQREVVKNERRQSYDNRPYGLAFQLLDEALYPPEHPYSWPVVGYMDHLDAADYEDVVDFFRRYYAPSNAVLVIAGDIAVEEARALADQWFGEIPAGPPVPRIEAAPARLTGVQRIALEDRVQLPRLYMAWITPPSYADGDTEMVALTALLAGGRSSRLYRRLVYELEIADDVIAVPRAGKLASDFVLWATARSGHTLEELERVILEEIERVRFEPATAREVARTVNQWEVGFLEQLEAIGSRADRLNHYYFFTGTPDYFAAELARFRALTPADLMQVGRRYLDPDRRVVLSIVPDGRRELAVAGSAWIDRRGLADSPGSR